MAASIPNLATPTPTPPALLGWRRLRFVFFASVLATLPLLVSWTGSYLVLLARLVLIGISLLLVFGLLERWPATLPAWLERWALQIVGVFVMVPFAATLAYLLTSAGYADSFWHSRQRMSGFGLVMLVSFLMAPWMAVLALVRQIRGEARNRALAFELERSQLERQALDARMRVLQAQVEPHFLFNTLANVRELVDSGSPQASSVLGSLIAYLRAAVPRLHEDTSMAQELELVRAYLEVMQMRMPDRLQFLIHADERALSLPFPAMALLTLVENAVRHGIDPSEEGGRIELRVSMQDDSRCRAQVCDTGVGMRGTGGEGSGTGLANLRERMRLVFGPQAQLRLSPMSPHGTCAELEFPLPGSAQ